MEPVFTIIDMAGTQLAELTEGVISSERDATDVVGNASFLGADRVLLRAEQLAPEFYDLSSGLAGAVMQKFSTYRVGLIVVGYDSSAASDSLLALIRESNRGSTVWFVADTHTALSRLKQGSS